MAPVALQAGAELRPGLEDAEDEGRAPGVADGGGSVGDGTATEAGGVGGAVSDGKGDGVSAMDGVGAMNGVGETDDATLTTGEAGDAGDAGDVFACPQEAATSAAMAASEISRCTLLLLDWGDSKSTASSVQPHWILRLTAPGLARNSDDPRRVSSSAKRPFHAQNEFA
jgi:hypothetical protein